jgi:hypothetical protein
LEGKAACVLEYVTRPNGTMQLIDNTLKLLFA